MVKKQDSHADLCDPKPLQYPVYLDVRGPSYLQTGYHCYTQSNVCFILFIYIVKCLFQSDHLLPFINTF